MKSNLIYKIKQTVILAMILALSLGGCTNLDEEAFSELTPESFSPSEDDLLSFIISGYTPFRLMFAGNSRWFDLQEEPGNCIVTATRAGGGWDDAGRYKRNHFHTWTSEQPQFTTAWDKAYEGIAKCNLALYQIETGLILISDPAQKEALNSELKCLRAIYFYTLLDLFGNVPITTRYDDVELPVTTKRKDVFAFIEKEFLDNMSNLHPDNDMKYYGRITQPVARAILMRMYLNAKVYIGEEKFDQCITQCDEIMKHDYKLADNYLDPFIPTNENCKENIFIVQCDDQYAQGFAQFMKFFHALAAKVYQMTPQSWNGSFVSPQFLYSYRAGDLRKKMTWLQGEQKAPNGEVVFSYYNDIEDIYYAKEFAGYRPGKYLPKAGLSAGSLSNDWVVIRLAEVYYAKAECLLRKGGAANEEEAAKLVSKVRQRSFETPQQATITADFLKGSSTYPWGLYQRERKEGYVEEIYVPGDPLPSTIVDRQNSNDIELGGMFDEWLWEFASEGQNRIHLIRYGAYTTKKWFNHTPNAALGQNATLFAIPHSAISKNNKLDQNTGY